MDEDVHSHLREYKQSSHQKLHEKLEEIKSAVLEASKQENLSRKLDEIQLQLDNLSIGNRKEQSNSKQDKIKGGHSLPYDVAKMDHAKAATTVRDYISRLDNVKLHYASLKDKREDNPDGVYCTDCTSEVAPLSYGTYPGVVRCPNIKPATYTNKQFQNLKNHMLNHMKSKCHRRNVEGKSETVSKETKKRNELAAINCARLAYNCITQKHSYLAYETDVTVADANGTFVGNKNHSREFYRDMVKPFYESLRDKFRDQITTPLLGTGRPSPFTDICDKWTGNGRTYNIVGANAYGGGKLNTYFLDAYVVKNASGAGIAESMVKSNDKVLDSDWRNRYVGSCSDGAMLRLNYKKDMDKLVNEGAAKDPSASKWYTHLWDSAHVVELANNDVETEKHQWVKNIQDTISELNQKYKYGKSREEATDIAAENEERFYAPQGYSNTRWSAYANKTFQKTYKNYKTFYEALNNKQDEFLDKINNSKYVLQSALLSDISEERSKLSRTVQVPDIYCWNISRTVQQTCDNLQHMSDTLSNPALKDEVLDRVHSPTEKYKLLPRFYETVMELKESGTHQGMPTLQNQHYPVGQTTRGRSSKASTGDLNEQIKDIRSQGAFYIDEVIHTLRERFDDETNDVMNDVANLFDLERVLDRDPNTIPEPAFTTYATGAYAAKLLDQYPAVPPPTWHQLREEYKAFQSSAHMNIKQKFDAALTNETRRKIEKNFYDEIILEGRHGAEKFLSSNQLLATATVRLRNESQMESMASQLKKVVENRNIDPERVSQEGFMVRNGPPPNKKSNELLSDGLCRRYGPSENWPFVHTSDRIDKLKFQGSSAVLHRKNEEDGRVVYKKNTN